MKKVLIIILLLAFGLRLLHVNESIWIDEATRIFYAQQPFMENIGWVAGDTNMPLYHVVLWFWIRLFGIGEIAVRMLSILFALGAVYVLYQWKKPVGMIAALLLAANPYHVYLSTNATPYSLFVFLAALSQYFYEHGKPWPYVLASVMLIYTHIFGVFMVGIHLLFRRKWWPYAAGTAASFLLWLPVFLGQAQRVVENFWIASPSLVNIMYTLSEFSGSALLMAAYGILVFKKPRKNYMRIALVFVPVLFIFAWSQFFRPLYNTKYFTFALPAFLLYVSSSLKQWDKRHLIIAALVVLSIFTPLRPRPDWRGVSRFMEENIGEGDVILLEPGYELEPFSYYHDPQCFTAQVYVCGGKPNHVFSVTTVEDLEKYPLEGDIWLIRGDNAGIQILEQLKTQRNLKDTYYFDLIEVHHFSKFR